MFPQYGRASGVAAYAGVGNPAVPTHGFLSHLHWTLVDAGGSDPNAEDPCPTVVLEAESTTETYAVWPYHFRAVYTVSTPLHIYSLNWGLPSVPESQCCMHCCAELESVAPLVSGCRHNQASARDRSASQAQFLRSKPVPSSPPHQSSECQYMLYIYIYTHI